MSIYHTDRDELNCTTDPNTAIQRILHSREKDLGGFSVRRVLPYTRQRMVGPWIFFDHMGPATLEGENKINVRPHPHINLATVTYLFAGEILHRDSVGSVQTIRPGDINLMVAGKGIVHSERERPERLSQKRELHGLQLWMALPEEQEEIDPAFYHHPAATIPTTEVNGVPVRVMMGEAYGIQSPVETFSDTLYLEARLKPGQELVLPQTPERAVYVASGSLECDGENLKEFSLTVFNAGAEARVQAREETYLALIGGAPLGERHMFWNFVSSRKERLEQAKEDWKEMRFPLVPEDDQEFIPLPE